MAANDNVIVRIVGDASGVQPAVQQTDVALGGLEPLLAELNASMKALTAQMAEGFTTGAANAKKLAAGIEEAKVAAGGAGAGFSTMIARIHEGAESVRTFQMRAKEFAEVYVALFAVERVAEFINKMGEAAEKTQHLAETFGMSTGQIQQLQGVAAATGISIDALTKGMQMLDRNMANAAMGSKQTKQAMDAVGVSLNDGRTQMEKLAAVADKFKNMDDGPKKVALAMQLFGRSGAQLIPILNLGRDGIEQLNQKMQEYGVVNDDAVAKGVALAENVNETKLGFQGIENVLTAALAPAFTLLVQGVNDLIKAFVESYKEGGIVAVLMGAIAAAITIVVDVVETLGGIFKAVWDVIVEIITDIAHDFADVFGASVPKNVNVTGQVLNVFKDTLIIVKDAVEIFIETVSVGFRTLLQIVVTFAKITFDALTFQWGKISSDWSTGMGRLVHIVDEARTKIVADAGEMAKAIAAAAAGKALGGDTKGLDLPKGGGGGFDYNPHDTGKEKKPKDDLVQRLERELEEKKVAFEKEQLAQDTAQQYSLQSEADFWSQALKRTDLSAKDRFEIQKKWIAAEQALQKDRIEQQLDGYKQELANADKNAAAKLAILQREQAFVHKMYGDQSREARAADDAVYQADKQAAEQRIQLAQNVLKAQQQLEQSRVDEAEKNAELEEQMGLISKGKLLQQERQFEQQRYQIDLQALQQRKALIDPNRDPVAYQQISLQLEQLERQHQQKLTQIDRQAVLQRTAVQRQAIGSLSSSWAQTTAKMLTLQEGLADGIRDLYMGLVQTVAGALEQVIEAWLTKWLTSLLIGKAAHQATATTEVISEAGKAGAGGVASMAAAPFPINLTAPAFGASMASMALGYLGLASAEQGDWNVNEGLYHLHEQEMVLPSWAANPLRAMLMDPGTSRQGGGGQQGDSHFHYAPTLKGYHSSWDQMMRRSEREARRWFKRQVANGALTAEAA